MCIDNASFFCYIYSSWLTKYLWKAYRRGITLSDIPAVSPLDSCTFNIQKFENLWNEELRLRGPTSASLPLVAWRFVRFRVLISCILNACSQIVSFVLQTILLRKLLEYSENPEINFFSGMHWVIYIVAFDLFQMILCTWSDIMNQRTALRLKSACLSLLFKKVVHRNNIAHKNTNELINTLSKDGQKIYDAVKFGTSIVNGPVVTICTVICISTWLSPLALMGLVVFLLFYLIQYWLRHLVSYCEENANEFTKARVQKTIEVLNCIRLIKINGWEQHFIQNISNIRNRESKWLWKLSYVNSLNSSMTNAIPIIAIIVTFFLHFTMSRYLTASVAFPICIVIIVQMHGAFTSMKTALFRLKDSIETFSRIKSGLLLEDTSCHVMKPYEASQAVAIVNGCFVYDIYKKDNHDEIIEDTKTAYPNDNGITQPEKQQLNDSSYEPKRIEILSNINFKAKKGQLIGICGTANSGKSSLLLAALGQIKMTNGQLMRQGSCAYVSQKAWITNGSIRDNVLFEEAYDAKRYYEAQVVCKLRLDLKKLPDGDETEIGEGGVEISESLRQRISLARAFYGDRDIYFLDDPLSSMEDKVGNEIFEDLIVTALAEKTIVFVTQQIQYLNRCDYMYVMRGGKITEHGRHKELIRLGREYAAMIKAGGIDAEGDYTNEFYDARDSTSPAERKMSNARENIQAFESDVVNHDLEIQDANNTTTDEDNVETEEIAGMTYYTYAKSLGGFFLLLPIIVVYVIYAGIGVLTLLRLAWWIEAINRIKKESTFAFYKNWFGFCFFFVILGCVVQSFVMQLATTKIADNLHNTLLNKLMHAPIKFFDTTQSDKIKKLFSHDLNNVSLSLPSKLDNVLRYVVIGFFIFFVLISTIPWFTNYVVFTSILFFIIGKIYKVADTNFNRVENSMKLPTNNFLLNSIQGLSTIRTFKKENDLLSKFQELVDLNNSCCFIKGVSERWLSIRLQVLTTTCVLVAASLIVIMKGEISPAIAGLTFVYILQVPNIIQMGIRYFSKTQICFVNVQHICNYLQVLTGENDNKTVAILPDSKWPTTGLIELENVQLRYSDDAQVVLDHVSLTINNAEKIGVLIKSESGKSALIAAMYRLYELNGGKISIDSIDISKIDIKLLRNQLSIIPQDPILYGTVRFFLDPTKCHADSEIWSALERVHLKDKISAVASQLLYSIDGKFFSIIEKQLLFLARAFLHQNKILLLEESTGANSAAGALVRQVIEKEFSSSTVLIIARRLRTALSCDRVLVMDSAKVMEFDSPATLLANRNSNLRRMMAESVGTKSRI